MAGRREKLKRDRSSNFALWAMSLFILVAVGRIHELWLPLESLRMAKLALTLGLIGFLFQPRDNVRQLRQSSLFWPATMLILLAIVSISWSVWRQLSLNGLTEELVPVSVAFFLLVKTASSLSAIRFYVRSLILAAGVLALVIVESDWSGHLDVGRTYDPNDLALVLVTILPLITLEGKRCKGFLRTMYLAVAATVVIAILLTQSRGGFIALLITSSILLVSRYDESRNRFQISLPGIGGIVATFFLTLIIWTTLPGETKDRLVTVFDLSDDYNVSQVDGRLAIWQRAIVNVKSRPYGTGFHTISIADGLAGGRYQTVHNSFLQVAVELGVVGLFIYIVVLWRAGKIHRSIAFRQRKIPDDYDKEVKFWSAGLLIALISFSAAGVFLSQAYAWVIVVVLALSMALELVLAECPHTPTAAQR